MSTGAVAMLGLSPPEAAPGTYTAPTVYVPIRSVSPSRSVEVVDTEAIVAGDLLPRSQQYEQGAVTAGVNFEMPLQRGESGDQFWQWLLGGARTGDGTAGNPYAWANAALAARSVLTRLPSTDGDNQPVAFVGSQVGSWTLDLGDLNSPVTLAIEAMAMNTDESQADPTPAVVVAAAYAGPHATLTAAPATKLTSLSIAGNNQLAARHTLGTQVTLPHLPEGLREIVWTIGSEHAADDWADLARSENPTVDVTLDLAAGTDRLRVASTVRLDGSSVLPDVARGPLAHSITARALTLAVTRWSTA